MPSKIAFSTVLTALLVFIPGSMLAQTHGPIRVQQTPVGEMERRAQREREKKMNKDRQESLKRDTDKLLELANQLKQYVDKSNENTLSLDVINKAGEIEKLAHNVKEKMRGY